MSDDEDINVANLAKVMAEAGYSKITLTFDDEGKTIKLSQKKMTAAEIIKDLMEEMAMMT